MSLLARLCTQQCSEQRPWRLQVLTEELGGLVGALSFTRSMRWNSSTAFSRPVRWLLALHGSTVLPFQFAGLQAGKDAPLSPQLSNLYPESSNQQGAGNV